MAKWMRALALAASVTLVSTSTLAHGAEQQASLPTPHYSERAATLAAIAKALGYNPGIGLLQAGFGTPQDHRIQAVNSGPSEGGPGGSERVDWRRVNLDVTGDGMVDSADLAAARAGRRPGE